MTAVKRMNLSLSETDTEIELKKSRYLYPAHREKLSLERLEKMDITEQLEARIRYSDTQELYLHHIYSTIGGMTAGHGGNRPGLPAAEPSGQISDARTSRGEVHSTGYKFGNPSDTSARTGLQLEIVRGQPSWSEGARLPQVPGPWGPKKRLISTESVRFDREMSVRSLIGSYLNLIKLPCNDATRVSCPLRHAQRASTPLLQVLSVGDWSLRVKYHPA